MSTIRRSAGALSLSVALLAACAPGGGRGTAGVGSWEHTTSTANGVTTVRTIAGSGWGGEASVVEELSVGLPEGPEPYTFGSITDVWASDERILVADRRLSIVRAYDADGRYLFDVGAAGQGPGEYQRPAGVAILPDGRLVVYDGVVLRVYDAEGRFLERWGSAEGRGFLYSGPNMMALVADGAVYVRKGLPVTLPGGRIAPGQRRWGMQRIGPEGAAQELVEAPAYEYEPPTVQITIAGERFPYPVPLAPSVQWAMLPDGGFVSGLPTEYRFRIEPAGGPAVVVEKVYEPIPIGADEAVLAQRMTVIGFDGGLPEIDWSTAQMPATKPAYDGLVAARDGRVMVLRSGPTTVRPECMDPSLSQRELRTMDCTEAVLWVDVFEPDGEFLGTFRVPDGLGIAGGIHIDGDRIWAGSMDALGTVSLKRVRIVPPGERPAT